MTGTADDMPCHHEKSTADRSSSDTSSSGKNCPCMAACLSLCFQAMPPVAGSVVVPTIVKLRTAFQNSFRLASLAPSPPARPPRT
jgi:hypothetical protein